MTQISKNSSFTDSDPAGNSLSDSWNHQWLSGTQPFADAEAAWFWCLETSEAVHSGARLRAGMGAVTRPCEPVDIQNVVLRLARQQLLNDAHLRALCTYGPQQLRPKHRNDSYLWQQAMERMTPILQRKGIIQ